MTEIGRLTKRPEYLRVAAARRKWVTPGMVVQALPRERTDTDRAGEGSGGVPSTCVTADCARLGITVSRKVGNSVRRNRARRRLRAVAREVLPEEARPGTDYVLIGRAGTLTRGYDELREDLRGAVRHLNAGKGGPSGSGGGKRGTRRRGRRGGSGTPAAEGRGDG